VSVLNHETISGLRTEFRALFDNVGSDFIATWFSLQVDIRVAMATAAVQALQFDDDQVYSLMVAAPELFHYGDEVAQPPPLCAVDQSAGAEHSVLAELMVALRNGEELQASLWPPALDFESDMAAEHGAESAAAAFVNLKLMRSAALLQVATNIMLIRLDDADSDGETEVEPEVQR
jgi:hypothetical protein